MYLLQYVNIDMFIKLSTMKGYCEESGSVKPVIITKRGQFSGIPYIKAGGHGLKALVNIRHIIRTCLDINAFKIWLKIRQYNIQDSR